MLLNEAIEENVIQDFKNILELYDQLFSACNRLAVTCEDDKDLKFEAEYLADFVKEELGEKINNTKDGILDVYYPIDYGDDEADERRAGEIYRDSKEAREEVFK